MCARVAFFCTWWATAEARRRRGARVSVQEEGGESAGHHAEPLGPPRRVRGSASALETADERELTAAALCGTGETIRPIADERASSRHSSVACMALSCKRLSRRRSRSQIGPGRAVGKQRPLQSAGQSQSGNGCSSFGFLTREYESIYEINQSLSKRQRQPQASGLIIAETPEKPMPSGCTWGCFSPERPASGTAYRLLGQAQHHAVDAGAFCVSSSATRGPALIRCQDV